jgi:sporulation integral membrane protein YtvI
MGNIIFNKVLTLIIVLLLTILACIVFSKLFFIVLPFYLGYLVSKLFTPVLKRIKTKHKHLLTIITFIMLFLFISIISFLIFLISKSIIDYISAHLITIEELKSTLFYYYDLINENKINFPFSFSIDLDSLIENSLTSLLNQIQIIVQNSLKFLSFLPDILIFIIIIFISAFFFTIDNEKINDYICKYILKHFDFIKNNHYFKIIKKDVLHVLYGYIRAQLILISVTFVICSIGLGIIGINNFILKAFIISLIDALPIFGTAIILLPWAFMKLLLGNYFNAIYLFILYLVLTITRQSIEPKIFSSQIGIYPLITLFSIYTGLKTIGFLGIFIGPIIAVLINTLINSKKIHEHS